MRKNQYEMVFHFDYAFPKDMCQKVLDLFEFFGHGLHIQRLCHRGYWKDQDHLDSEGFLVPNKSLEWFLQMCWEDNKQRYNASHLLSLMERNLGPDLWHVFVTDKNMYHAGRSLVVGAGIPHVGAAITSYWFNYHQMNVVENFLTTFFHEVGHMLGAPHQDRGESVENYFGWHCTNKGCVMRQRARIMEWAELTKDRLKQESPYCPLCMQDIQTFLNSPVLPPQKIKTKEELGYDDIVFEVIDQGEVPPDPKFRPWQR